MKITVTRTVEVEVADGYENDLVFDLMRSLQNRKAIKRDNLPFGAKFRIADTKVTSDNHCFSVFDNDKSGDI